MLAKKTEEAISILYTTGGFSLPRSFSASGMDLCDRQLLIARLTAAGFLDRCGQLCFSLDRISLYDLLAALDEGIYPTFKEDRSYYGFPTKQQLYHSMMKQLLSRLPLSELWRVHEFTHTPLSPETIKSEII